VAVEPPDLLPFAAQALFGAHEISSAEGRSKMVEGFPLHV
jgi:hypothetical protein